MRLAGKTAVVTAAAAGIGRASALLFAREGARVIAVDRDLAGLTEVQAEAPARRIEAKAADVCSDAAMEQLFAEIGRCDVLLNAVGIVQNGSVLESTIADFTEAWQVNVVTMIRTMRLALPGMIEAGAGSIINVSSVASSLRGVANRCSYGASKAAIIGLSKAVAADFVAKGVRCNALCPGTIDTPSLRARAAAAGDPESALAAFRARQPMNRLGKAEEVAAAALFLASDESAFVTGQAVAIDGGWTM